MEIIPITVYVDGKLVDCNAAIEGDTAMVDTNPMNDAFGLIPSGCVNRRMSLVSIAECMGAALSSTDDRTFHLQSAKPIPAPFPEERGYLSESGAARDGH